MRGCCLFSSSPPYNSFHLFSPTLTHSPSLSLSSIFLHPTHPQSSQSNSILNFLYLAILCFSDWPFSYLLLGFVSFHLSGSLFSHRAPCFSSRSSLTSSATIFLLVRKFCLSTSRILDIRICLSSHLQTVRSGLAQHSSIRQRFRWHSPGHTVTEKRIRKKKDNRFLLAVNPAFQSSSASAFIFLSSDFPLLLRHLLSSCLFSLPSPTSLRSFVAI